ncbi:MAG: RnfABCDGE type electron transport complex subunit E [Dehalococcoidia bacterium]|nr:MAG: RnfABCDGE type electron transport complex subunit E [Dehalococcoidia bacterium]
MGKFGKEFAKGLIISNPVLVLALGLCPTLAITTSIDNALGMTLVVLVVLVGSSTIIAAIRNFVPSIMRIPIFIVIIASLVTVMDLIFQANFPDLHVSLGIFLPLVVVNCIILARAEVFASKNPILHSIADALGITVGFMLALLMISSIRQILGTGSLSVFGFDFFTLPVLGKYPIAMFILPPGAFLIIGLLMALFRWRGVMKSE